MSAEPGTVYLLDDEPALVRALTRLLRAAGFRVDGFTDSAALLAAYRPDELNCLVLDVAMPGISGLELQAQLAHTGITVPIVFLTGRGDIPTSVRAMKSGAVDFLTKPVDEHELIAAVRQAMRRAEEQLAYAADKTAWSARWATLTPREREVMAQVVAGKLNKQIAADLGTGEQNIKVHRGRVMAKLGVTSVADLVRVAAKLGAEVN